MAVLFLLNKTIAIAEVKSRDRVQLKSGCTLFPVLLKKYSEFDLVCYYWYNDVAL